MKTYLFLLIIICLGGGWYYYDNFYKKESSEPAKSSSFSYSDSVKKDVRIDLINSKAFELFPSNNKQRDEWIDRQIMALSTIDKLRKDIPQEISLNIRKNASKEFPFDFEKQLTYVVRQEMSALGLSQLLFSGVWEKSERKNMIDLLEINFPADYNSQNLALLKVTDAYKEMKRKANSLSLEDFDVIRQKVFPILLKDINTGMRLFNDLYLARHNYLNKSIPVIYGDLRNGIEETYPLDFIAQYEELNSRVERAIRGDRTSYASSTKKSSLFETDVLKSHSYSYSNSDGIMFILAIVNFQGKPVCLFPSSLLEKSQFSEIPIYTDSDKVLCPIYVSNQNMLSFVEIPTTDNSKILEFMSKKEIINSEYIEIEIIYMGKSGTLSTINGDMKFGKIYLGLSNQEFLKNNFNSIAYVFDKNTKKLISILVDKESSGIEYYQNLGEKDFINYFRDGMADKTMKRSLIEFKKMYNKYFSNEEELPYTNVFIEDVKSVQKFDKDVYQKQTNDIKEICKNMYWIIDLMVTNTHSNARESKLFGNVTKKYDTTFKSKTRVTKQNLYNTFSRYLFDINNIINSAKITLNKDFFNDYYPIRKTALIQYKILSDTSDFFSEILKSTTKEHVIFADLASGIKNDVFISDSVVKSSGGVSIGSGGPNSMSTIRFKTKQ